MSFFKTLLVGLDGSAASQQAVTWAAERVSVGGSLHLVHATAKNSGRSGVERFDGSDDELFPQERERADRTGRGEASLHIVDGDPVNAMLTMTDLLGADAIVVGPHSTPTNIGTLGRVTRRLLQQSSIPIIVARHAPHSEPAPEVNELPVVACLGYGEAAERTATWAADYAEHQERRLTLLHVIGHRPLFPADSPSDMLASYLGGDVLRSWAREDLEDIRDRVRDHHGALPIETTVAAGSTLRVITATSAEAELIVLGKRETAVFRNFVSPRIHQLIAKAAGPVALVPSCSSET